jgi:membrane associated rhomboid family serine protease
MFPIQDGVARRYPAIGTWALIAINVIVFLFQVSLSPRTLEWFIYTFALIPSRYFGELKFMMPPEGLLDYLPFVSNMFLHGGWLHLILNMWTLWIFGPAVEDRLGTIRFLGFYLTVGVSASLAHALVNMNSVIPALGASGAIAGVIGCYVRRFPTARLVVMVPILFFPFFFEIPAIIFSFFWLLTQVIPVIVTLMMPADRGGIAWWAHIGGFMVGWVLAPLIGRSVRSYRRYYADEGRYGFLPNGRRLSGGQPWV